MREAIALAVALVLTPVAGCIASDPEPAHTSALVGGHGTLTFEAVPGDEAHLTVSVADEEEDPDNVTYDLELLDPDGKAVFKVENRREPLNRTTTLDKRGTYEIKVHSQGLVDVEVKAERV